MTPGGGSDARRPEAAAWRAVGWFGLAILFVGLLDVALVWYPVRSGNPAWEFGAVDGAMATTPVILVGLMCMVASGAYTRSRWLLGLVGVISVALTLVTLAALFVYWTDVPMALSGVPEQAMPGIRKSMVRTTTFGLVLLTSLVAAATMTIRIARSRSRGR